MIKSHQGQSSADNCIKLNLAFRAGFLLFYKKDAAALSGKIIALSSEMYYKDISAAYVNVFSDCLVAAAYVSKHVTTSLAAVVGIFEVLA